MLTLAPWTLQRLVRREFEVEWDADGSPKALEMDPRYGGVSIEEMEESLRGLAGAGLEDLFALRDNLTPERISEAFERVDTLILLRIFGYLRREDCCAPTGRTSSLRCTGGFAGLPGDRSLNNNTFLTIYVLMGYALPEQAQGSAVQRTGTAQAPYKMDETSV